MLTRVVRLVWVAGFLVGTTTHVVDLVDGGRDVYAGFPIGVRAYWVSLTVLDPVAAVLTALRRRSGVVLGVAIMVSDVAVNATVLATTTGLGSWGLILQAAFGAVVAATAPRLWRAAADARGAASSPRGR
ncbi:hypothetical protein ACOACO_10045 [Nocardioides sp. CPCC 205120]|uniref:hypothetical protein n=1 Tax=Nocardioides sp. CPCC 205120 TaxID=3406462 RepID=UPI003B5046D4